MHVWLVKLEEKLPIDKDYRPYRMGMLGSALLSAGHRVTRWCSDYRAATGTPRFGKRTHVDLSSTHRIELLSSGLRYSNSASVSRLLDNFCLARQFEKDGRGAEPPDVVVCSMPTPGMAEKSAILAQHHGALLVLDSRDYWPDVFESEFVGIRRFLAKPVIWRMRRSLRFAASRADALVGITEFYRDHLVRYSGRVLSENDAVFPLGFDDRRLELGGNDNEFESYWNSLGVKTGEDRKILYFAGRINRTVLNGIGPVLDAAKSLSVSDPCVLFVFAGSGSQLRRIRELAASQGNIILPGEVPNSALNYLRRRSYIALQPIEKRVDYQNSLSNKFFEYLSSGLPILSWLDGVPGDVIKRSKCGYVYVDSRDLVEKIRLLVNDKELRDSMGLASQRTYESNYRPEKVYGDFVKYLEELPMALKRSG